MLEKGDTLPPKYKAHDLKGDYAGCMECHVEGDMLLVWIDYNENMINAYRLGSHAEIFGKGVKR